MERILDRLGRDEKTKAWVEYLEGLGSPDFEVRLPAAEDLLPVLVELAVPHEDIDDLVRMLPSRERSPEIWWLLERCVQCLVLTMGSLDQPPRFQDFPHDLFVQHRYFYVYVYLAALPHVRRYHQDHEIPERISRLTLADLGRHMAVHRWGYGGPGLESPGWMMLDFRGANYALGRLQFERVRLSQQAGEAIVAAGLPYGPGDPALSIHMPSMSGPLTPTACDASLEWARTFFPRHFPNERYEIVICNSWVLDPQLAEYLPDDSNVIQFQRRFQLAYHLDEDNENILRFIYGRTRPGLDELPQRTRLERAIVRHLQSGRNWHGGVGWLRR